jgi:MFS family permease
MSGRASARLAWALAALALGLLASGWVVAVDDRGGSVFAVALALTFSLVGALIASRHPGNAIGWILLAVAVSTGLGALAGAYADRWLARGGPAALGETAAWYASLSWIPFILVPCTFLLLLFPDGHLPSRRWRWVAWCAGAGIVGGLVMTGVAPGPLEDYPQLQNPYGIESPLLDPLTGLAYLAILIGIAGSSASLVVRFRRARGELRHQIKWLALAGAVAGSTVPIAAAGSDLWGDTGTNVASMLGVLSLPVAAAIAILRHRLYDIDVVINRTLVYGALTAILGGTYLGLVVLTGLAVGDSNLAIAGSTLAVAALFRPARARIQGAVDRRFYRRRYDAAQTLEAFSRRRRDEIDLEALADDLRGVVRDTVAPAHVSLWLRGTARNDSRTHVA